jgi:transportin-1
MLELLLDRNAPLFTKLDRALGAGSLTDWDTLAGDDVRGVLLHLMQEALAAHPDVAAHLPVADYADFLRHPSVYVRTLPALFNRLGALLTQQGAEADAELTAGIRCLDLMAQDWPASLVAASSAMLQVVFAATERTAPTVQAAVAHLLCHVVATRAHLVHDHMEGVVAFALHCLRSHDEEVLKAGAKFWPAISQNRRCHQYLTGVLDQLVPLLLQHVRYSPEELETLEYEESRGGGGGGGGGAAAPRFYKNKDGAGATGGDGGEDEDGDEDEDDGDDGDDEGGYDLEWTVRKACAKSLDCLSWALQDMLLPHLLPQLQACLVSENWLEQEAGVLTLGAVSQGCYVDMVKHLPTLMPGLLRLAESDHPLIKSITLWTLTRFALFFLPQEDLLHPVLACTFGACTSPSYRVRKAGITAVNSYIEQGGYPLVSKYASELMPVLVDGLRSYDSTLLTCVYDAIASLSEVMGSSLVHIFEPLAAPLADRWAALDNDEHNIQLFPLYDLFSALVTCLGSFMDPFAPQLWFKALDLVTKVLTETAEDGLSSVEVEDLLVAPLDLMGQVAARVSPEILRDQLIAPCADKLSAVLQDALRVGKVETKRAVFGLFGDAVAKRAATTAMYNVCMEQCLATLARPFYVMCANNAAWALIHAIRVDDQGLLVPSLAAPVAAVVAPHLSTDTHHILLESLTILIANLALRQPAHFAPLAPIVLEPAAAALAGMRNELWKVDVVAGLCALCAAHPPAVLPTLHFFIDALVEWDTMPAETAKQVGQLLQSFAGSLGAGGWERATGSWNAETKVKMQAFLRA